MPDSYYLKNVYLKKKKLKKFGKNCKISNKVIFLGAKNIYLGNNVRIDDYCIINGLDGYIKISDNTKIGSFCYLLGSAGITIGKDCNISQGVKIYSKSNNYKVRSITQYLKKVKISNNVIIGSNSVLLPGADIGEECRIGALTLISKKIKKKTLTYGKITKKIK